MRVTSLLLPLLAAGMVLCSKKTPTLAPERLDAYRAEVKQIQKESWGEPDVHAGENLSKLTPGQGVNPDEVGTYLEGDMLIIQPENILGNRFAEIDSRFRWPNGIVYYAMDGNFNSNQRQLIQQAIAEYHKHTCIRFKPYTGTEPDYLLIQSKNTGCWSGLGRTGGKQIINLQAPGCVSQVGVPMHELMHTLGIFHEQSRADRDNFVNIVWPNIERGKEHNFKQHKYFGLGLTYDYGSIMHYSVTAFSKNKQPTIATKFRSYADIGQRKGFSEGDIEKLNLLYNCYNENLIPFDESKTAYKSKTPIKNVLKPINPGHAVKNPAGIDVKTTKKPLLFKPTAKPKFGGNSIEFSKNIDKMFEKDIKKNFEKPTTIDPRLINWINKYQSNN